MLAEHHTAGIIIAPRLAIWKRPISTRGASAGRKSPIVEMLIPSTLDETLAPKGAHVASLFCQHVAPICPMANHGTIIATRSPIS